MPERSIACALVCVLAACSAGTSPGLQSFGPPAAQSRVNAETQARAARLRAVENWPTGRSSVVGRDPRWKLRVTASTRRDAHGRPSVVGSFPSLTAASRSRAMALRKRPHTMTVYCDDKHDDTAAIQALLTAGGTVSLPAGTCLISNTLTIAAAATLLVGAGGGFAGDGAFVPGTGLKWIGPSGGTILRVGTSAGGQTGGGVIGIGFVSNGGLAGNGLYVDGWQNGSFAGIAADSFSASAITFVDTADNVLADYSTDNENIPPVTCNTGTGLSIGLPGELRSQSDIFEDGFVVVCNGVGIAFNPSVLETVFDTQEITAGKTGYGVVFGCGSDDDRMVWLTPVETLTRGVVVDGASTCGSGAGSNGSSIDLYDKDDNGAPKPVVASGTNFTCTTDAGYPCAVIAPAAARASLPAPACNGTTNDTSTIQNLINAGGIVNLPAGTCIVKSRLNVLASNVFLQGAGGSYAADGAFVPQTILKWAGGTNGTLLRFGGGATSIQGGGINAITLDSGNGIAANGLDVETMDGGLFMNFSALNFTAADVELGQIENNPPINSLHNFFSNYTLSNTLNGGTGLVIDKFCEFNGCYLKTNFTDYNEFNQGYITVSTGTGVLLNASDGNLFLNTALYEDPPSSGVWAGTGFRFGCFSISNHLEGLTASTIGAPIAAPAQVLVADGVPNGVSSPSPLDVCGTVWGAQSTDDSVEGYAQSGDAAAGPSSGDNTGFWCTTTSGSRCTFQTTSTIQAKRHV